MGYLALDHTVAASNTIEQSSLEVGDSVLLALSAIVLSDTTSSTDLWIEIGLLSGGDSGDQRAAILANGYAGAANSVFWTGIIPTGTDARAFIRVIAGAGEIVRLSSLTSRDGIPVFVGGVNAN